jgi:hypothetical protein
MSVTVTVAWVRAGRPSLFYMMVQATITKRRPQLLRLIRQGNALYRLLEQKRLHRDH